MMLSDLDGFLSGNRNDLYPCGSEKKFKKCYGKAA
jgi:hypothetical protein